MTTKVAELLSLTHICGHQRVVPVPEGVSPETIERINALVRCPTCLRGGSPQTQQEFGTLRKTPHTAIVTSLSFPDASVWKSFRAETTRQGKTASEVIYGMVLEYLAAMGV